MKKLLFITILCCFSFAQANPPVGKWMCYSFDFNGQSFKGLGQSMRLAMHDARGNCLKNSSSKGHCKTAQSYCEQTPFSDSEDRCVSVDGAGKSFNATGPESCAVAMTLCDEWQYQHGNSQSGLCRIVHR